MRVYNNSPCPSEGEPLSVLGLAVGAVGLRLRSRVICDSYNFYTFYSVIPAVTNTPALGLVFLTAKICRQ